MKNPATGLPPVLLQQNRGQSFAGLQCVVCMSFVA